MPSTLPAQGAGTIAAPTGPPPANFAEFSIDSLIRVSRQPARGENETTTAYRARLSASGDVQLRLAKIPGQGTLCEPLTTYNADAGILSVHLVQVAGVIVLRCGGGAKGVSSQGDTLDAMSRIPLAADSAERVRPTLSYWLAFRREPTVDRGPVWQPFPSDTSVEGLVATDIALWVQDASGRVVFKDRFERIPTETFVKPPNFPPPAPLGTDSVTLGISTGSTAQTRVEAPPTMTLAEACSRPNRVALVSGLYDAFTLYDLRAQLHGAQMNGMERGTSWEAYLARSVDQRCNPSNTGWTFPIDLLAATFKFPGEAWCSSANTGGGTKYDCNERYPAVVPDGWQVCRVRYQHRTWRHGRLNVTPVFYSGDPPPARYRGVTFHITGHGDVGNTSGVRIWSLEMDALLATATVDERRARGCDMPGPPPAPQVTTAPKPPTTTPTTAAPAKVSASLVNIGTHVATLWIRNTGGSVGRICWRVVARDGDDGQWDDVEQGCASVGAGESFTRGLSKMRNQGWNLYTW